MRRCKPPIVFLLSLLGVAAIALADAKVEQQPLGPDGESLGCAVSPHGGHVAVLASKGSRFVVLLDGVEGPRIDAMLSDTIGNAVQTPSYWMGQIPVVFSDDGAHSAYLAKAADQFIVFLDGKELARSPIVPNSGVTLPLTFSTGGKHLFYMVQDDTRKYEIVVDGKPGPASYSPPQLVISTNGAHYAYIGDVHDSAGTQWAVVDGRQVNFFGNNLQYTGRGVLLSTMNVDNATVFVLNGKPEIKAYRLDPMWMSPDGAEIAMVITPKSSGSETFLTVNGKMIPGTEGLQVEQVYFSPDGKRYAALVHTKASAKFMIIDGKKGEEYQDIPHQVSTTSGFNHWIFVNGKQPASMTDVERPVPGFTADSSKFVYVAGQGARQFMVVEDQESNGFQSGIEPILSPTGHRIGLIGIAPNGKQHVILDDKEQEFGPTAVAGGGPMRIEDLTFTQDGTRCAFVNGANLWVDGVAMPGMIDGAHYTFSPDDKHIVYLANDGVSQKLFLDGKVVDNTPFGLAHPFFSPDNQHLFWLETRNYQSLGTKDSTMLFVDGKPAVHFSDSGLGGGAVVNFEFSSDGVLTFVARTDENLRRFHVTPSPDANVGTMLAAATAPAGK